MGSYSNNHIVVRLWGCCLLAFVLVESIGIAGAGDDFWPGVLFVGLLSLVLSTPVLLFLAIVFPRIRRSGASAETKLLYVATLLLACVLGYTLLFLGLFSSWHTFLIVTALRECILPLTIAAAIGFFINRIVLLNSFSDPATPLHQTNRYMDIHESPSRPEAGADRAINKPMIKGLITAALILLMLIPTAFIANLVEERQHRQQTVVTDVSHKWADEQTFTGPYLYIPYLHQEQSEAGKTVTITRHLYLLPETLSVTANIVPEQRTRSIYKVLLYRSSLTAAGSLQLSVPKEIDPASLRLADARICIGVSDFRGIEQKLRIRINDQAYDLLPGLPATDIDSSGLSAPIDLTAPGSKESLSFQLPVRLRGSGRLHFTPLAGNSDFTVRSAWPDPSFDGSSLPTEREVRKDGFSAKWAFSKASLPFNTVLLNKGIDKSAFEFGVSTLQPADQYAKTTRSIKYAILIIGLTFALFFIIEVMQNRPMHPVQYVLIGLALSIFYTLLLSVSEFLLFDQAYLIAATATVLLITLYARSHFRKWRSALLFGGVLSGLYGFIFILIRLEDTALLLGSIGLFLILCGVMYGSRRVNWYAPKQTAGTA